MTLIKKFSFLILIIALSSLSVVTQQTGRSFAENDEADLFLVAQKAFDDGFYDVATRYIDQFLEKYPQTAKRADAKLLLGQCYFLKTQYLKAFDIFQELQQFPEFKDAALFWLGETYLKGSDYKQAESQYKQLVDLYPESSYAVQGYYSLGWTYFNQKDFTSAKNTFEEFVKKFPNHELSEDVLFKIGECNYNLHDYAGTIRSFQEYVTRFPQSSRHDQAYFYMAESNYYLDNLPGAIEYYAKTGDISHDDKITLMSKLGLGWSYLKSKDYTKSQQAFDAAQKISQEKNIPSDDIYLGQANLSYEAGDYTKALEAYSQLLQSFPGSPRIAEAYLGKANALYLLKNYDEAIKVFKVIIETFSADPNAKEIIEKAYLGLGWAHLKSEKVDLAIANFQEVVNRSENKIIQVSALTQIGDAYQDMGEIDKSLEVYDKILKDFPDSLYTDYVQYRQGIALLRLNKIEAATLAFQSLKTNFPTSKYLTDIKYYLGLAYFKKEDWAAAKEQLTGFINEMPAINESQPEAQYLLGLSNFNLQNYDEAIKAFQKVIKNYPDQASIVKNAEIATAKAFYGLGDAKEAAKRFKIIIYKYPKTDAELESLTWLGDYYLKTADYVNAEMYYKQLIENFPGSDKIPEAHYSLGQIYQETGQLDKALNDYKLIGESSDSELATKAKLAIADIFSKEVNPQAVVETYQKIADGSPEFARDAYVKIAETYRNNNDYENAMKTYQDALKANAGSSTFKNAELQFNIADLIENLNKPNEAVEAYLKIPYLYPDETIWAVKAYLRIARIFENAQDWENAKLTYNKIIAYGTEEVKFAQERLDWINSNAHSPKK
ncbi:MAG TPA: tetratricopeptide repeat protein [Candidatus Omnitrophota bacterium]|nr:tetratricopeptide repeat protein [Candidatus Omnitrophota bacterium]HPD85324.1 tetratricopeptide repeat protein [Candidatus Omnitrophota bacterium]HRZ04175.1 tetratricopeptide repeat protein [Candidatus Omnitrophota bacterium]